VCYIDKDDKSRWDIDRKRDKDDRLMHKIRMDEEKERNDKFNFWIYVAFIVLGIILLIVIIYSIVSLLQKKDNNVSSPPPSSPPMQQQITNKSLPVQDLPKPIPPKPILKTPYPYPSQSPSPSPSPSSSIPFPSITSTPVKIETDMNKQISIKPPIQNKGFLSSIGDNINKQVSNTTSLIRTTTNNKGFLSSLVSPITERSIIPPQVIRKGGGRRKK